jgi:DNA-binding response OmpR family regulator
VRKICYAAQLRILADSTPTWVPPFFDVDPPSHPLEGEDIQTTHWEDARHWMSIYADLLEFKRGVLDRVRRDVTKLPSPAREAAERDVEIIAIQMEGYQQRLDLWYRRVWDLHGLWLDREGRTIHYGSLTATMPAREFQLFEFLLDHPHRYLSVAQILSDAWARPDLFPEEVRTYVRRLRNRLAELDIPCDIINQPRRGYSLRFRQDE